MTPKRWLILGVGVVLVGMGVWIGLKPDDWQTWLGFTKADYFTTGQNYALYSGFLPCFLTVLGMGSIVTSLWKAHNCHVEGCYRIGRHKVNGTPWCDLHEADARHVRTIEQILEDQNVLLARQNDLLKIIADHTIR